MSNWLPEMIEYIKTNQMALKQSVTMGMPVARFTVHILNTRDDEASRTTRTAYTASVRQPLIPTEEVFFAGKIDCARLSLLDRLMAMAVEKQTGTPPGNYRNWEQIRGWAGNVLS
jgi:menaquinone-dependent protoporphyrinogen oxidase